MAEYRYVGVDILSRKEIEDLPLSGVYLTRRLGSAGTMTGSFRLGTGKFSDSDLMYACDPGRTALWVYRDNVVIWAGPIWSRTYNSEGTIIMLTGQTYESALSRFRVRNTFSRTNQDQILIFKDLMDTMQNDYPNMNLGIDTSFLTACGVTQSITVNNYDSKFYFDVLGDMQKMQNTFDWSFLPVYSGGQYKILAQAAFPYAGFLQDPITFDYPGQITDYYYPESAANGTVLATVVGNGSGSTVLRYNGSNALYTQNNKGYPVWNNVYTETSLDTQAAVQSAGQTYAVRDMMPIVTPTLDMKLTPDIEFGQWNNLGVNVMATIEDPRFPNQFQFTKRMLGWDLTPNSSESVDLLKLVLEGNDAS